MRGGPPRGVEMKAGALWGDRIFLDYLETTEIGLFAFAIVIALHLLAGVLITPRYPAIAS
jgi:hypothetical protein